MCHGGQQPEKLYETLEPENKYSLRGSLSVVIISIDPLLPGFICHKVSLPLAFPTPPRVASMCEGERVDGN